ncbi:ABC transporter ATP-binding protein [Desulfobulbus sp.]|uniref:energy-coupling factor ABC transporter ATP-binding protein n=1 Tax=Desulfobulbus sp. TaxID=895 RepID=UPI00286F7C25|nr:ABC transporter ATP-binding protein [Desulfobulbus sp.]
MSPPLIEVRDLAHAYPDGTEALRGISLHIRAGEAVAVVGANGAGKSTLLLHLNGSLIPQHGTVRIADFQVAKAALPDIRRTVGMVFQDPDDQLFMPTVAEDVAFGPLNLKLPLAEVERRVASALEQVGAAHLRDRPPYKLSGGEKRLAAIATVLAMEPAILVMDEPSSSLDPRARRTLTALLAGFGHTTIIATHDLDLVLDLCPRTIVLRQGQVAADGPTGEIFADNRLLAACHLEPPLRLQACPVCGGGSGWLPQRGKRI